MNVFAAAWSRRKYWLMPLIVFALLVAALLFLQRGGDALRPFMYKRS